MRKIISRVSEILIFASLIALFFFSIFKYTQGLNIFSPSTYILNETQNTPLTDEKTRALLEELVKSKMLLSVNEIYARTLNYYDHLISILVALLAVLGGLTFIYIRTSSRDNAREDLKEIVSDYLGTEKFKEKILRDFFDSRGSDLESKIEELKVRVSRNEEGLEVLDTKGRLKTNLKKNNDPKGK